MTPNSLPQPHQYLETYLSIWDSVSTQTHRALLLHHLTAALSSPPPPDPRENPKSSRHTTPQETIANRPRTSLLINNHYLPPAPTPLHIPPSTLQLLTTRVLSYARLLGSVEGKQCHGRIGVCVALLKDFQVREEGEGS